MVVRAIKALREVGCPLQKIVKAKSLLEVDWDSDLASSILLYDGNGVYQLDDAQEVIVRIGRENGQAVFHETMLFLTFPLRSWMDDANSRAVEIDVADLTSRRELSLARRQRTRTLALGRLAEPG